MQSIQVDGTGERGRESVKERPNDGHCGYRESTFLSWWWRVTRSVHWQVKEEEEVDAVTLPSHREKVFNVLASSPYLTLDDKCWATWASHSFSLEFAIQERGERERDTLAVGGHQCNPCHQVINHWEALLSIKKRKKRKTTLKSLLQVNTQGRLWALCGRHCVSHTMTGVWRWRRRNFSSKSVWRGREKVSSLSPSHTLVCGGESVCHRVYHCLVKREARQMTIVKRCDERTQEDKKVYRDSP